MDDIPGGRMTSGHHPQRGRKRLQSPISESRTGPSHSKSRPGPPVSNRASRIGSGRIVFHSEPSHPGSRRGAGGGGKAVGQYSRNGIELGSTSCGNSLRVGDNNMNNPSLSRRDEATLGYRRLAGLAEQDGLKILEVLSTDDLSKQLSEIMVRSLNKDWITVIITILAKLCQVEYHECVVSLLMRTCRKEFMDQLMLFIVCLEEQKCSDMYSFLNNLCFFYMGLVRRVPSLACERLSKFIQQTKRAIKEDVTFKGTEDIEKRLEEVEQQLERLKVDLSSRTPLSTFSEEVLQYEEPPNNFQEMDLIPTLNDLFIEEPPFLRPNIVKGPYRSVDHYLDVQFRLMREDFVRPLREGIKEYQQIRMKQTESGQGNRKQRIRVNNIRLYEKVVFEEVWTEDDKIGIVVCFDPDKKRCTHVNWEHSKSFMFGSLLLFTENNFASFILAKVANRKIEQLQNGKVVVELCAGSVVQNIFNSKFTMVESQVFFEPYFNVLKALQGFDAFSFPLVPYIIEGKSLQEPPAYLDNLPGAQYKLKGSKNIVIPVMDMNSWPCADDLGCDKSQYEALKGALTRKVMLIQGPPGTGKTFLGLKVAHMLLENCEVWRYKEEHRPILVVCYTNHALDQFLTGILSCEQNIVRVGGGSKDENLNKKNLKNLKRCRLLRENALYSMIYDLKSRVNQIRQEFEGIQIALKKLNYGGGIVSSETFHAAGIITDHQLQSFEFDGSFLFWLEQDMLETVQGGRFLHQLYEELNKECCFEAELLTFPGSREDEDAYMFSLCFDKVEVAVLQRLYGESKVLNDSKLHQAGQFLEMRVSYIKQQLRREDCAPQRLNMLKISCLRSLWNLSYLERWQLYRSWVSQLMKILSDQACDKEVEYRKLRSRLLESKMIEDQAIMATCKVIGMTTSYAASHQAILKQLKPRIVIIEEAAEILESHVVAALAGDCQHLIMIGDHQQLRPNPAVYELARKYHLDVSLFERLLNNGIHCVTLSTQHRMRPEVAQLISPTFYPILYNHKSVRKYPPVRGVTRNVFFLNHTHHQEEVPEIQSYKNTHEASFIVALVRYLLLQGYENSQITILCTYKGQLFHFSSLRTYLSDVRISVVDNFQGEENDIILLSLVRSNEEEDVGFLKTENRVCVALSRAKQGLFILGNMGNLIARGEIWPKVKKRLDAQGSFGETLTLCCSVHGTYTPVKSADDFDSCPEGGCLKECSVLMPCGHVCESVCHVVDREHKNRRCSQPCSKSCPQGHKCKALCYKDCPPCSVPREETLACGHRASIPCHRDSATWDCKERLVRKLIPCNHETEMFCSQDHTKTKCLVRCNHRLVECGHVCTKFCHERENPDHKEFQCHKPCERNNLDCKANHKCRKVCYEECELCTIVVEKTSPCGHKVAVKCHLEPSRELCKRKCTGKNVCGHKCTKKCNENCDPCLHTVLKEMPKCKHKVEMPCAQDPSSFVCPSNCEKKLPCGHVCTDVCGLPCSTVCRELIISHASPCGHTIYVPCSKRNFCELNSSELLGMCEHPCGEKLACDHQCKGTCGRCYQGRLHEACKEKCGRVHVCGHPCTAPCAASCPPCSQKCVIQCVHSPCPRRCGEPCTPCKERCENKCIHKSCGKTCSEICCPPCMEPCRKKIKRCKHDCVGFCGDPCPKMCRECDKDELTSVFFGTEEAEDARFVLLPDCGHVFEATGLEEWLNQSNDEIKLKVCPRCTTNIMRCPRYDKYIKIHAENVAKVKGKIYGGTEDIKINTEKGIECLEYVRPFCNNTDTMKYSTKLLLRLRKKLLSIIDSQPKKRNRKWTPPLSLLEIKNVSMYCEIVKEIYEIFTEAKNLNLLKVGNQEIVKFVEYLCENLSRRPLGRLSDQEAGDINNELVRFERLIQVIQVEASPNFASLSEDGQKMFRDVVKSVRGWGPYPKDDDLSIKRNLMTLAKMASASITEKERKDIVAAMGLPKGHWFNCPNGHPYVIGNCGGAMVEAKCNECGEGIGGRNHQLLATNSLATNLDGAASPAWPPTLLHNY